MDLSLQKPQEVSRNHFLLNIKHKGPKPKPGQFINLKVNENFDPLLRRPFSIFDHDQGTIKAIIKKIGRGTSILAQKTSQKEIDYLGPLGKPFNLLKKGKALLIGGGVGNAPLFFLAKELTKNNIRLSFIYGTKTKRDIFLEANYRSLVNNFLVATEDGSQGEKGLVTDLASQICQKEKFDKIYTCGPTSMMQKIVKLFGKNIPIEVSLENYFGCGIGLCSGCTVQTTDGLKRACVDGPVFEGQKIDWESL